MRTRIEAEDIVEFDDTIETDLSFLDEKPPVEPASPPSVEAMSLDVDLTDGWATIDEEIQNAIPSETPPGYTDELNELNVSGVEPFFVEADEPEAETEDDVDEAPVMLEDDVVSDELAAGIDLWSFDGEPADHVLTRWSFRLRRMRPRIVISSRSPTRTIRSCRRSTSSRWRSQSRGNRLGP